MAASPVQAVHPFPPVWNEQSRILVLGSFPSVLSRSRGFYYANPQNRFWKMLSLVFEMPMPVTTEEKRELALSHGIALWDVLSSCTITGSGDSSIRNPVPNDIGGLVQKSQMTRIVANGKTAAALYRRYCEASCGIAALSLPSTSPANASWSLERLAEAWQTALIR